MRDGGSVQCAVYDSRKRGHTLDESLELETRKRIISGGRFFIPAECASFWSSIDLARNTLEMN